MHARFRKLGPVLGSIVAVVVMMSMMFAQAGVIVISGSTPAGSSPEGAPIHMAPNAPPLPASPLAYLPNSLSGSLCSLSYGALASVVLTVYGYACSIGYTEGQASIITGTRPDAINNTLIDLYNYLNMTASMASTFNATSQELLSYYANRAEAMASYYVNTSWTPLVADEVATYSGFAASVEGMVSAIGESQYQSWNATAQTFQSKFGAGAIYCCSGTTNMLVAPYPNPTNSASGIMLEGDQSPSFSVTAPWELWPAYNTSSATGETYYMNLEPGGTLLNANYDNATNAVGASWVATDLTTGTVFPIPTLSFNQWVADAPGGSAPVVPLSKTYHVGQFDLLRVTCSSGCTNAGSTLLTNGAYVFNNLTELAQHGSALGMVPNNLMGTAFLFMDSHQGGVLGNANLSIPLPLPTEGACIGGGALFAGAGACSTQTVPTEGFATEMSSGPGQAIGGNGTLTGYGPTFERLMSNVLMLAHAYHDVLRAITDNGTYALPPTCALPFPSDAFPAATNPAVYGLSLPNVEVSYLGYLGAVGQVYGSTFAGSLSVCGDANLALTYNWTTTWHLRMNITASLYLGSSAGAIALNGSLDPTSNLSSPLTWPVRNIDPVLLYPFEFNDNVPVGQVYPVPVNDPMAALLINDSANPGYGSLPPGSPPLWGVPTYLLLAGHGNYVYVSGSQTSTPSGASNATGDALYISTCVVNGVSQSTCPLGVTYFDNFTFGIVHANLAPTCAQLGSCGGGGGGGLPPASTGCGFTALNSWYDAWAGYLGSGVASAFGTIADAGAHIPYIGSGWASFWNGLGCILAWIVVLVVLVLVAYILFRVIMAVVRAYRRE